MHVVLLQMRLLGWEEATMQYLNDTIQLTMVGRQDCSDMHSFGPGMQPCYVIHYIVRGGGYLEYGGKRYHVRAGESFLFYPYTTVYYYPEPEDPWEYVWVNFIGKGVDDILADFRISQQAPVFPRDERMALLPLYEKLEGLDIYRQNKLEANGLLLTLLGIYADELPPERSTGGREYNAVFATAMTLIHSNYFRPDFTVQRLCDMMRMDRTTLYRLFRKELSVSPNQYIVEYRLKQACRLLRMGLSVKAVAASCGFSDQFYFSKTFKQHMGTVPSRYHI